MEETKKDERQYWVWVARPEYYLDEDGNDREDLDPAYDVDTGGWWTCHKTTRQGDLALLWRTTPKKDIGYLMQAESDAYSIAEDEYASKQGWDYGCDCDVLYKFRYPITIQDLHNDPDYQDEQNGWGAYRAKFFGRVFRIPPNIWEKLNTLASSKDPTYRKFIKNLQTDTVPTKIVREKQLEEALVQNLSVLKKFGYDLELYYNATTGVNGQQLVCKGNGGRIDLLCYDRKRKQYVVIELKNVRAGQNTFGQIANYMGWVQDRIAGNEPVIGLVISRGYDVRFETSMKITDRVFHLNVEELGFK